MANTTNKIFVDKMGGRSSTDYVGVPGEIFYDPAVGDLRLSDGASPGGRSLFSEQTSGVYRGFQAGVNFFRNTNDQDIAQIIIHNARGPVDYINFTKTTHLDDFYATNLRQVEGINEYTPANKVIVLNLYGSTYSDKKTILSISDVRSFVRTFIDTVMFDTEDNELGNLDIIKESFYNNITTLKQSLPDGTLFERFAFDDNERIHYPEYNAPEGRTPAELRFFIYNYFGTNPNYSGNCDVVMAQAGDGWQVGDTVTINGEQLGGEGIVNDLTFTVTSLRQGGVTSMVMTDAGSGLRPHVNEASYDMLDGGIGNDCGITVISCNAAGAIVDFKIAQGGGNGYQVGDILTLNIGNDSTPAQFEVTSVSENGIRNLELSGEIYNKSPELVPNGYWPNMMIADGRDDQYDVGNFISTDVSTSIVVADTFPNKINILDIKKQGMALQKGMLCTAHHPTNEFSTRQFRLSHQSTDDTNVWYVEGFGETWNDVTIRIDGISYANGNVTNNNAFNSSGTSYVTVYDQSIFAMIALNTDINSVYYNGNMGADGNGYKEASTLFGARTVDYVTKSIPQTLVNNSEYTLALSDAGKHIYYDNGGSNTVYLNAQVSETAPIGTAFTIVSGGDGWTFITPTDSNIEMWGAGLNQTSQYFYIPENSMATLLKIGQNKWMLSGAGLGID